MKPNLASVSGITTNQPTHRQLLNRSLLAQECDEIITAAFAVHDVDQFCRDRQALLELIRAARIVRDAMQEVAR